MSKTRFKKQITDHRSQITKYFVHETAIVDAGAKIGDGTKVWHFSHVMSGAEIGENCILGQNVFIANHVKVGNTVKIQNNVSLYEGVVLEDEVFCGPSCVFTNVFNPRSAFPKKDQYLKTWVKRGVTIGANATIVCGRTIGEHAFIGAGAVVTQDIPAFALAYGSPAKVKSWVCLCGEKLNLGIDKGGESGMCESCGSRYKRDGFLVICDWSSVISNP